MAKSATSADNDAGKGLSDMEAFKSSDVGKKVANPTMKYAKPDNEALHIPFQVPGSEKALASQPHEFVSSIKALHEFRLCEPRQYRAVDYLVAASELLLDELIMEYDAQMATFKKRKDAKGPMRFTWKNSGKLAINFALACDCAKLLSDVVRFVRPNSTVVAVDPDVVVVGYVHYIQRKSGIPDETLSMKTYLVKLQDWKKGGTRYTSSHSTNANADGVNNIKFPTAIQRREKLESFIQGGKEVEIESKVVTEVFMTNVGGVLRPLRTAGGTIYTRAPKKVTALQDVISSGPGPVPRAPGAVVATKSIVGTPLQYNAFKQNIFSLFGGVVLHFPPNKMALMGAFVRLIEKAPDRPDKQYCLRLITNVPSLDSVAVYHEFDKCGGLLVLRQWIMRTFDDVKRGCVEVATDGSLPTTVAQKRLQVRQNHLTLVHSIIEFMANLYQSYSLKTRTTWLAPTFGIPNPDASISAPLAPVSSTEPTGDSRQRRHLTTTAFIASTIKSFAKASLLDEDIVKSGSHVSTTVLFEYTQKYNTIVDEKLRGITSHREEVAAEGGASLPGVSSASQPWQVDPTTDVLGDFPALTKGNMEVRDFVVEGGGPATDESQLTTHQRHFLEQERANWKMLAAHHGVYAGMGINPHGTLPTEGVRGSGGVASGPGGAQFVQDASSAAASAFTAKTVPFMPTLDQPLLTGPLAAPVLAPLGGPITTQSSSTAEGEQQPANASDELLSVLDRLYCPLLAALEANPSKPGGGEQSPYLTHNEALAMRSFLLGVARRRATTQRVGLLTRCGFTALPQPGLKRARDEGDSNSPCDCQVRDPAGNVVKVWPTPDELLRAN